MYAIAGMGVVLTYKTSGIFNFAHGAMGMLCTYIYFKMVEVWAVPAGAALALTLLLIAPLMGIVLERLLFRPLLGAPMVTKIIVTIGLLVTFEGVAQKAFGTRGKGVEGLLPTRGVSVAGVNVGLDQIAIILIGLAVALALGAVFRYTKLGTGMLATVDNRPLAGAVGVDTNVVSALAWAISTSMAALAGILLAPILFLDSIVLPLLVINAYSAAMLGALDSLPLTLGGGLLLGIAESMVVRYVPSGAVWTGLKPSLSFFFLAALLLLYRRRASEGATNETLVPREARRGHRVVAPGAARRLGIVVLAVVALVAPKLTSASWTVVVAGMPVFALLYLSLV